MVSYPAVSGRKNKTKNLRFQLLPVPSNLFYGRLERPDKQKEKKKRKGRAIMFKFRGGNRDGIIIFHLWNRDGAQDGRGACRWVHAAGRM